MRLTLKLPSINVFGKILEEVVQWIEKERLMVVIQIDEQTAKLLESAASVAGLSLAEYVRALVQADFKPTLPVSWDELEKEFEELSVDGSLPKDFSRADIYSDHD